MRSLQFRILVQDALPSTVEVNLATLPDVIKFTEEVSRLKAERKISARDLISFMSAANVAVKALLGQTEKDLETPAEEETEKIAVLQFIESLPAQLQNAVRAFVHQKAKEQLAAAGRAE